MTSKRTSIKHTAITHAIAIVFFVIVPTLITLMVPLTNLEFRKSESVVSATVNRYLLIFIPWKTERIDNVTGVRADITAAKRYRGTSEERRKGQTGVRVATGQVAILHDGAEVVVQAAPDIANQIVKQFDDFKVSNSADPLTFKVYASWSLSYILGGVAAAFCALYLLGAAIAIALFPFKLTRRSASDAT